MDREKVMRGLECCCTHIVGMSCGNCPYEIEQREDEGISDCTSVLAYDALAMLKEQEAVEPRVSTAEQRCGHCNKVIEMDGWQSCPWCGKRIDWKGWWKKNGTRNQDS